MLAISVLLEKLNDCHEYERNVDAIANFYLDNWPLSRIAETVGASVLTQDEKERLYDYLFSLTEVYRNKQTDMPSDLTALYEYINLIFASDRIEQELSYAIQLTKACMNEKSRVKISDLWRKAIATVADYNQMLSVFRRVDEQADLVDSVTRELFTAYHFNVDPQEMRRLISVEIRLSHIHLIERLVKCVGSTADFIRISGMESDVLAHEISHMHCSYDTRITAHIIAAEILIASKENTFDFDALAADYSMNPDREIALNLTAFTAYYSFLLHGCLSERIRYVLKRFDKSLRCKTMPQVIRLYIRCVEKCIAEHLDIRQFIEDTAGVNLFKAESDLEPLDWKQINSMDEDGFHAERAAADRRLEALCAKYHDASLLCYVFMNTHFGAFCNLKRLGEILLQRGEDVGALLYEYPISANVINIDSKNKCITVHARKYNIDNIKLQVRNFRGLIFHYRFLEYRITEFRERMFQAGKRFSFSIELIPLEGFAETEILNYIARAASAVEKGIFPVTEALSGFPNAEEYHFSRAEQNLFGGYKSFRIITACKELVQAICQTCGAEAAFETYMNSFLRLFCPIEEVCGILKQAAEITNDALNELLRGYTYSGRGWKTDESVIFRTNAVMFNAFPVLNALPQHDYRCTLEADESDPVVLTAVSVKETDLSSDAETIRTYVRAKLKAGSENTNTNVDPQKIEQAETDYFYAADYINFINGFFVRCLNRDISLSAVCRYLQIYAPINPFDYKRYYRKEWYRVFIRTQWPLLWNAIGGEKNFNAAKERLLDSDALFDEICYIFMNSPLRLVFELSEFLKECLENFVTESTLSPKLRLVCDNTIKGNPVYPTLYEFGKLGDRLTLPSGMDEYDWFSFEIDMNLDGTMVAVGLEPLMVKPIQTNMPNLERKAFPPVYPTVAAFFENPEHRLRKSLNLALIEIINSQSKGALCVADHFDEQRVFGKVYYIGKHAYLNPLNVYKNSKSIFKIQTGDVLLDTEAVYAMIPMNLSSKSCLYLLPAAQYFDDGRTDWKNCIKESDVQSKPVRTAFPEMIQRYHATDFSKSIYDGNADVTVKQYIARIRSCALQVMFSIPNLLDVFYGDAEKSEQDINDAMKDFVVFVRKTTKITVLNSLMRRQNLLFCVERNGAWMRVEINERSDMVFALRFADYRNGRFWFAVEDVYEYDSDIPWYLFRSLSDIPEHAISRRDEIGSLITVCESLSPCISPSRDLYRSIG